MEEWSRDARRDANKEREKPADSGHERARAGRAAKTEELIRVRDALRVRPSLKYMFLELTRSCNLRCLHCGSSCPDSAPAPMLTAAQAIPVIDEVADHTSPATTMFCITGGEPLLAPEWEAICGHIRERGFSWGMTTNGTLVDRRMAERLHAAGMQTVSVSIDGFRASHEALRGVPGCYDRAVRGLRTLIDSGYFPCVQVTTVVSKLNLHELEPLFEQVKAWRPHSWKVINMEPIGLARKHSGLLLEAEDYRRLFSFIRHARETAEFEVTYGCAHALPDPLDGAVRDHGFLCGAGTLIASVTCEGDITACLDIDDRVHGRMGSIREDDFWEVWTKGFELFRRGRDLTGAACRSCPACRACEGGPWHTWDFQRMEPSVCLYHMLTKEE